MAEIDITKLLAEAGIKQVPGVDDCYVLSLDKLEALAALVLEDMAKQLFERACRDGAADRPAHGRDDAEYVRTIAEGLKP